MCRRNLPFYSIGIARYRAVEEDSKQNSLPPDCTSGGFALGGGTLTAALILLYLIESVSFHSRGISEDNEGYMTFYPLAALTAGVSRLGKVRDILLGNSPLLLPYNLKKSCKQMEAHR